MQPSPGSSVRFGDDPADRRPGASRVLIAVVLVLALIGGVAGLTLAAVRSGNSTSRSGEPAVATSAPEVTSVLPELERFVERQRGLTFTTPVQAELLDDAAFRERLRQVDERDADPARTTASQVSLTALGLLPPGTDLRAETAKLLGDAVLGFYDPKTKALVVRGNKATPGVRAVLAHELTHALQDQHFNLDRPDLDQALDESSLAFSGLVEGDAERTRVAYEATLSAAERTQASTEENAGGIPAVPRVLLALLGFPYEVGPAFATAVVSAGGQPRLDAAFAAPPVSTEQLIDPNHYLTGDQPKPVAVPTPEGPKADEGVLGELGLRLMLSDVADRNALVVATTGWGGDRYVAWRDGARSCLRDTVVMDTAQDTGELRQALRTWAGSAKSQVRLDADIPAGLTFTSCR